MLPRLLRCLWFCLILSASLTFCEPTLSCGADAGESKKKETSSLSVAISGDEKPLRSVVVFVQAQDDDWSEEQTTTSKGVVSFPAVPRGRILIQCTPPSEWADFGEHYTLIKPQEIIQIKLQKREPSKTKSP
jgi:hypothetical protein